MFTALVLLVSALLALPADAVSGRLYPLLDAPPVRSRHGFIIEGTYMPVLDPYEAEHAFALPSEGEYGAVMFSIGLKHVPGGGTVRFEVLLQNDSGEPVSILRREVSEPGWAEERLDLPKGGRKLIFRKSHVHGTIEAFLSSVFGDPVLIPRAIGKRPSIVLLSIDTLRADRVGVYGYEGARTPALDRLAREGTTFENAYSPSTWTSPSHDALLRGLYPSALPRERSEESQKALLASFLRAAGYRTAAFTGGGYLSGLFSLDGGFGTYFAFEKSATSNETCSPDRFDGEEVFGRATRWLGENAALPFFLFVHTYDAHDRCPVVPLTQLTSAGGLWDPGPDGRKAVLRYYDELIAGVDRRVAALLAEIERLGIADSTLLVVTSDHGEAFWEHGVYGHGCEKKPYRELARVPLILRLPGVVPVGQRIEEPVSLVDIVPTVLDLAGLPIPAELPGRPLPLRSQQKPSAPRPVFVHCGDLLAVSSGRHRLLTSKSGAFPDEVYDIHQDPGEKKNLAGNGPALVGDLRRLAADYWLRPGTDAERGAPRLEGIDEKTKERLRALGYLE